MVFQWLFNFGHIAWKIVITIILFSVFTEIGFTIFSVFGATYGTIMSFPFFGSLIITIVNFAVAWVLSEIIVWLALKIKDRYG